MHCGEKWSRGTARPSTSPMMQRETCRHCTQQTPGYDPRPAPGPDAVDGTQDITALPSVLAIRECQVTIVALGCPKAMDRALRNQKTDSLLAIRPNLPALHDVLPEMLARKRTEDGVARPLCHRPDHEWRLRTGGDPHGPLCSGIRSPALRRSKGCLVRPAKLGGCGGSSMPRRLGYGHRLLLHLQPSTPGRTTTGGGAGPLGH